MTLEQIDEQLKLLSKQYNEYGREFESTFTSYEDKVLYQYLMGGIAARILLLKEKRERIKDDMQDCLEWKERRP